LAYGSGAFRTVGYCIHSQQIITVLFIAWLFLTMADGSVAEAEIPTGASVFGTPKAVNRCVSSPLHANGVERLALSADGRIIISQGFRDAAVRSWNVDTGEAAQEPAWFSEHDPFGPASTLKNAVSVKLGVHSDGLETTILRTDSGAVVGWFPDAFALFAVEDAALVVAGARLKNLSILKVELDIADEYQSSPAQESNRRERSNEAATEAPRSTAATSLSKRGKWFVVSPGLGPGDAARGENYRATCRRCGRSEIYDPRWGDRPSRICPFCGFPVRTQAVMDTSAVAVDKSATVPAKADESPDQNPPPRVAWPSSAPPQTKGKVWELTRIDRYAAEARCIQCGYSEDFDFAGGDRLPTACPMCRFDGCPLSSESTSEVEPHRKG
jgi:predicted nucleic-acid-binding Zn-ribbon protein